jgi:hypothetical protein
MPKAEGVSINYFINYTNFLSGSLPEINRRILDACGKLFNIFINSLDNMDVADPNAIVGW